MSRARYRWNLETHQLEELPSEWQDTPRVELQLDSHYDGLRATDGTPIDSRRKHREYMRINNLTTADDFKGTWEQAAKEREKFLKGDFDHDRRKRQLYEATKQVLDKGKRRR